MFYDALSLFQAEQRVQQDSAGPMSASNHNQTSPRIEMVVGHWYLDEFANPTREIKARD
ncbi:MAG: hypothetical protein ABSE67_17555 [Xanthobacteraceae bacterium]|jgi:hypothetical protein